MDLGEHYPCLNVKNLALSLEFYKTLGFEVIEDHSRENWAVLQHNNMALCLFEGHIDENLMNFRGGDVEAIYTQATQRGLTFTRAAELSADGSWSAEIRDPDDNCIFFNTFPSERDSYLKNGKLIDY